MELGFASIHKHTHTVKFNTWDLTVSFGSRQRCAGLTFWVQKCSASAGLNLHLCENNLPKDSPTTLHVFHSCSRPVFQDSGIPDSFPVYHYNGLKQSNHNERVRRFLLFRFFIATDGCCLSPYYFFSCHHSCAHTHTQTHTCTHTQFEAAILSRINSSYCEPNSLSIHPKTLA